MWRFLGYAALALCLLVGGGLIALYRGDIPHAKLDAKYRTEQSVHLDMGSGVVAHWRDEGNPNGRPLVLVHGFSSSTQTWDPWIPVLGGEYRLVSVDLPGHGLTRTPKGYAPSIDTYTDFVDAFMARIDLPRATIVGSSMGGHTAWNLALRHPERVEAIVLIGAAGWRVPDEPGAEEPAIFKLLRNPVLGPMLRSLDNSALVRSGVESTFVNKTLVTDQMVARYVDFSRAPNHRATLLAITLNRDTAEEATREKLSRIKVPTLVLHGDKDNLVPAKSAVLFGDSISGSRVVVYPSIGHLPQEEIPEKSAEDVRTFLHAAFPEQPAGAPIAAALP